MSDFVDVGKHDKTKGKSVSFTCTGRASDMERFYQELRKLAEKYGLTCSPTGGRGGKTGGGSSSA
jgi:hypothetical protein